MQKRILILLIASAVVAALVVYSTRRGPRAAETGPIPELLQLVPADSPYLIYAEVAALRSSPVLVRLAALAPPTGTDREYAEFVRATGFDYLRDLDRVVVSIRPAGMQALTVVLADGRFDRDRISAFALRTGKLERAGGLDVYIIPTANGSRTAALAFLSAGRVALADGPGSADALFALVNRTAPAAMDPAMRQHIERVAGAALFAVGRIDNLPQNFFPGGLRSDQVNTLVRGLRWLTLAALPKGEHMRIALEGECDTLENARQMAGTLDGLRLFARAALSNPKTRQSLQPQMAGALDSLLQALEISRPGPDEERRVRLTLEISPEMIQNLPALATPAVKAPVTASPAR